uniref:Putative RNA-directed DNA polymerase n=1 Tax=Schizaphis graminum TaxID=13262 RepID=A0A2S2PU05_SCHGA
MSMFNHLLLYKSLLQPIWSYGIALWGTAKPSNLMTIQGFQSICLCMDTKASWFVTNVALHEDLKVPFINKTAATYYQRLHSKMQGHPNQLIFKLHIKTLPGKIC